MESSVHIDVTDFKHTHTTGGKEVHLSILFLADHDLVSAENAKACVLYRRFGYRFLRFPVYGLAALQIQYLWKSYQQNAIYEMSTR